jgi:glycerophosphoryl diester phosphodiesterase
MTTEHYRELAKSTHFENRWHRAAFATITSMALVLVLVLSPDAGQVFASNVFGSLRAPGEAALIAAHRGDRAHYPENTLPALRAVLESDFDFVETDIQLSADGVPVLIHDLTVERTTNGTGAVADLTLEQLKALDAGSWYDPEFAGEQIPTLEEFLTLFQGSNKKALLELKGVWAPEHVELVSTLVFSYGVQNRVVFGSFEYETLAALHELSPLIPRVVIQRYLPNDPVGLANRFEAIGIVTSPDSLELMPDAVEIMHASGLGIMLYTLNKKQKWSDALALGVDGIITDKPSSLDRWIAENAPGT